ncbi:lysis protein [Salmonella enterica subsp. enterica serovar Montevideo]|nr:lysis protein [Salmonella enterica subsp. enterica serovar Montevideo]
MSKKHMLFVFLIIAGVALVTACQANYIRDVQGGTVAPSSSSELTGISVQ